jgi:integrase
MTKEFNTNMLRDRATPLPTVTDEMWGKVNEEYRALVEEYIEVQSHSKHTKKQYKSALRQFGWYIHTSLNGKPFYKVSKRDFMRYSSYLRDNRKLSSSAQQFKKAAVSSFCNFIESIIAEDEEYPNYLRFRNFTRGLPPIAKNKVYDKVKVTYEDYKLMMEVLEEDENYLGMAWLATAFNVGARRSEIIQFKTEILSYDFPEEATYVDSHKIRLKGRGEDGKFESYMINREAFKYMKQWVEKRGYDCEYIFSTNYAGEIKQMSVSWADYFCSDILSDILSRRINPHLFKASCVTYLLETGVPLDVVSREVAHHNDVSTTISHYDLRSFEEAKNQIFK